MLLCPPSPSPTTLTPRPPLWTTVVCRNSVCRVRVEGGGWRVAARMHARHLTTTRTQSLPAWQPHTQDNNNNTNNNTNTIHMSSLSHQFHCGIQQTFLSLFNNPKSCSICVMISLTWLVCDNVKCDSEWCLYNRVGVVHSKESYQAALMTYTPVQRGCPGAVVTCGAWQKVTSQHRWHLIWFTKSAHSLVISGGSFRRILTITSTALAMGIERKRKVTKAIQFLMIKGFTLFEAGR